MRTGEGAFPQGHSFKDASTGIKFQRIKFELQVSYHFPFPSIQFQELLHCNYYHVKESTLITHQKHSYDAHPKHKLPRILLKEIIEIIVRSLNKSLSSLDNGS